MTEKTIHSADGTAFTFLSFEDVVLNEEIQYGNYTNVRVDGVALDFFEEIKRQQKEGNYINLTFADQSTGQVSAEINFVIMDVVWMVPENHIPYINIGLVCKGGNIFSGGVMSKPESESQEMPSDNRQTLKELQEQENEMPLQEQELLDDNRKEISKIGIIDKENKKFGTQLHIVN